LELQHKCKNGEQIISAGGKNTPVNFTVKAYRFMNKEKLPISSPNSEKTARLLYIVGKFVGGLYC